MPKNPEEGSPRLITVTEIAAEHGVSRQTIHAHRRRGTFPQPVEGKGSTRPRFRADEVDAFFEAHPKKPGKRTDLAPQPKTRKDRSMAYIVTMRVEADSEIAPERIRQEIYDAAEDVPFSFDITEIREETL